MSDVDTSAETCRGSVALLRAAMTPLLHSERLRLARLIEALLAERDAERRLSAQLKREVDANIARAAKAEAERDAALAEVARLRDALEKIASRDPNAVGSGRRAIEYDLMRYEARAALTKKPAPPSRRSPPMTDPNGWPERPGVPLNPERPGAHALKDRGGTVAVMLWRDPWWHSSTGWAIKPAEMAAAFWRYLGPCLTPAEVAARVAEARAQGEHDALLERPDANTVNAWLAEARAKALEEAAAWHDCRAIEARRVWPRYGASGFPVGGPAISRTLCEAAADVHDEAAAAIRALKEAPRD